jgi:hypothetical protein
MRDEAISSQAEAQGSIRTARSFPLRKTAAKPQNRKTAKPQNRKKKTAKQRAKQDTHRLAHFLHVNAPFSDSPH